MKISVFRGKPKNGMVWSSNNVENGQISRFMHLILIADSERYMPAIKPGPLDWHTSAPTTEIQEIRQ
jgi:hypothetical protein